MLDERGWMTLNSMINEAYKSIGLEFYSNVSLCPFKDYTSYVQCKSLDYSPSRINALLYILPPHRCSVRNRRSGSMTPRMYEMILQEFC